MIKQIAVSSKEYGLFGCVNCGCEYCYSQGISGGGTLPITCGECKTSFVVLADGLTISRIGFGTQGEETYYPTLEPHPRKGTPKHEFVNPDEIPAEGGEYFTPRGVGYDLAGFVKCKNSGERLLKMFRRVLNKKQIKTWLDYKPNEPTWIQVKVQEKDGIDLEKLNELTQDGIINEGKIRLSLKTE